MFVKILWNYLYMSVNFIKWRYNVALFTLILVEWKNYLMKKY